MLSAKQCDEPAFLCIAYLYSDTPAGRNSSGNYSALLVCGFVANINKGIRTIVSDLLAQLDWETAATDDFMW